MDGLSEKLIVVQQGYSEHVEGYSDDDCDVFGV